MIWKLLQRKWDWQVYCWSHKSFKRIAKDRPGMMLVVELTLHEYNKDLDEDVRRAATMFHQVTTAKVNPDPPTPQGQRDLGRGFVGSSGDTSRYFNCFLEKRK